MTPMPAAGQKNRKRINHACMDNLKRLLSGEVSFEEWESRQEELESRLTPEPELPFVELPPDRSPVEPKAA